VVGVLFGLLDSHVPNALALVKVPPSLTVTAQAAVLPPSAVVTVMVAVPAATAVTAPSDTDAIVGALLLHVTALFVAFSGRTVAVSVSELPTTRQVDVLFKVTLVTAIVVVPPLLSPQAAIENPTNATSAIVPKSFDKFFIKTP
jgi:hypothetical protein